MLFLLSGVSIRLSDRLSDAAGGMRAVVDLQFAWVVVYLTTEGATLHSIESQTGRYSMILLRRWLA